MNFQLKYIALLFLLIHWNASAQVDSKKIKATILFQICEYISWSEGKESETFTIGVFDSPEMFTEDIEFLAKIKQIKLRKVDIKKLNSSNTLDDFHVLVIQENSIKSQPKELYLTCIEKGILLITDESTTPEYSMINLKYNRVEGNVNFEINKKGLDNAGLKYKDELLLHGGTIIDIRNLYRESKVQLETEVEKVSNLQKTLHEINKELTIKQNTIDILSQEIELQRIKHTNLDDSIKTQKKIILKQSTEINKKVNLLLEAQQSLMDLKLQQYNLSKEIVTKEQSLQKLDTIIREREFQIKEQFDTLNLKEQIIKEKDKTLALSFGFGALFFLSAVFILKAYRTKKRYNAQLELEVDKRTMELRELNSSLEQEIEKRKLFEEKLIRSERNYREIFNSTSDAIIVHALNGKILDVNSSMLNLYGYNRNEIEEIHVSELSANETDFSEKIIKHNIENAIKDGMTTFDWKARRKNNECLWVQVVLKTATIGGEERILALVRDIDEKKRNELELENYRYRLEQMVHQRTEELEKVNNELEAINEELFSTNESLLQQKNELQATLNELKKAQEQLVESEKMASIGFLAAGVAHEINNPLNFIQGGLFGLTSYIEEHLTSHFSELKPLLKAIDTGIQRATNIVTGLNHFSRRNDTSMICCNLDTIISNCLVMLQNNIKNRITISKDIKFDAREVTGNEGKLHQALLNILINATQAIENNGVITITSKRAGDLIKLQISDTGSGMDKEIISKIFEPFYTTKDPGEGTGLGLSITQKIISEHSGSIQISSELGKGTTVSILLPMAT